MSERDESSERTEMRALGEMARRLNKRMKKNRISFIIVRGVGLKNYIFFLDVCYSAHLSIDVHRSKSAKNFSFASTAVSIFWYIGGAKIAL